MRKEAQIRICDKCNTETIAREATFGGTPFQGWFQLELTDQFRGITFSTEAENEKYPKDFCSFKCLHEFVNSPVMIEALNNELKRNKMNDELKRNERNKQ